MPNFEETITKIEQEISVHQKDRQPYTKDFDVIIKYLMDIMQKTDPVFKQIYNGPSLFGSYLDNIKVVAPDEFDVHFLLKLPYQESIAVEKDYQHPGCVKIKLTDALLRMRADYHFVWTEFSKLVDPSKYLYNKQLQDWVGNILNQALKLNGNFVPNAIGTNKYELKYIKKGTAHTVKAKDISNGREISMDLVPALKFNIDSSNWFAERTIPYNVRHRYWFAVPKPCGLPEKDRDVAFSICVPQMEKDLLNDKFNMKPTLRLFKSIRDEIKDGYRLSSYFIKTLYLYENDKQNDMFWQQPQGKLLIQMLDRLLVCLDKKSIQCYWNPSKNLMSNLRHDQILYLKNSFEYVRVRLDRFSKQSYVDYQDMRRLFGTATKRV